MNEFAIDFDPYRPAPRRGDRRRVPRDIPWEDPIIEVRITSADRAQLARLHTASYEYPRTDAEYEADVPARRRDVPICSWCGEPWGLYGCRSLSVIAALESAIHANTVLQKRARAAAESLADGRSFADWRVNSQRGAWEVRAVFSTEALLVGGFGAVTHGLLRISREMRKKYDELTKPRGFEALGQALAHALADQARDERRRTSEAERKL
jgi:hypothetical protein